MSKPHNIEINVPPVSSSRRDRIDTDSSSKLERAFWWLAGADARLLRCECPGWEKIKYGAFGASVLVPMIFGTLAASYAVSTLTSNPVIIYGFAIIWGLIILAIDRVLLATYRAHVSSHRKTLQFALRMSVAILMGLTVSHPLALLIFKDTINSETEKRRDEEVMAIRQNVLEQKKALDARITSAQEHLAALQTKYEDTLAGTFLKRQEAQAPIEVAPAPQMPSEFRELDHQIESFRQERDQIRRDLESWQAVYDQEISGNRSGIAGIGPLARQIERDQLGWRQDEIKKLNQSILSLTQRRTEIAASAIAAKANAEAEAEATRRQWEKQRAEAFSSQQGPMLDIIKGQIALGSGEMERLKAEADQLTQLGNDRIDAVRTEKRADLMTQTLILHEIFKKPDGSGLFALMVYIVLAGLFTLIDTIPLVVKFFSAPGPYDALIEAQDNMYKPMTSDQYELGFKGRMMERRHVSKLLGDVALPSRQREWESGAAEELRQRKISPPALLPQPRVEKSNLPAPHLANRPMSDLPLAIPFVTPPAIHTQNEIFDSSVVESAVVKSTAEELEPQPVVMVQSSNPEPSAVVEAPAAPFEKDYFNNREVYLNREMIPQTAAEEIGLTAYAEPMFSEEEKKFSQPGFGNVLFGEKTDGGESSPKQFHSLRTA